MDWRTHITSDDQVLLGKPTVRGKRISIEHITGLFAQGWTEQQIFDNHPRLTTTSLQAVLAYINNCIKDGRYSLPLNKQLR